MQELKVLYKKLGVLQKYLIELEDDPCSVTPQDMLELEEKVTKLNEEIAAAELAFTNSLRKDLVCQIWQQVRQLPDPAESLDWCCQVQRSYVFQDVHEVLQKFIGEKIDW